MMSGINGVHYNTYTEEEKQALSYEANKEEMEAGNVVTFRQSVEKGNRAEIMFDNFCRTQMDEFTKWFRTFNKNSVNLTREGKFPPNDKSYQECNLLNNPDLLKKKGKDAGFDTILCACDNKGVLHKLQVDVKGNYDPYDNRPNRICVEISSMAKDEEIHVDGTVGYPDVIAERLIREGNLKPNLQKKNTEAMAFFQISKGKDNLLPLDDPNQVSFFLVENSDEFRKHLFNQGVYEDTICNKDLTKGDHGDIWKGEFSYVDYSKFKGFCLKVTNGKIDYSKTDFSKASDKFKTMCQAINMALKERDLILAKIAEEKDQARKTTESIMEYGER